MELVLLSFRFEHTDRPLWERTLVSIRIGVVLAQVYDRVEFSKDHILQRLGQMMPSSQGHRVQSGRNGGRPTQAAAVALRSRILECAFGEFVDQGIEGTSMDGIAEAAQVSKHTLYTRFGSKKALLVAALQHRAMSGFVMPQPVPAGALYDRILLLADWMLDAALTPGAIGLEFLIREVVKSHPDIPLKDLTPGATPFAEQFYQILIEDDAFTHASDSDARFLSEFLFDALVRAPRSRILHRQELANTREATRAYLERTLHLISTGAHYLARPRSDTSTCQEQN
jgi:AcrR family transcriptional regulator